MIQPIVEGDGEVAAVPVLLRRLLPEMGVYAEIGTPIKQNRYDLVREDKCLRGQRRIRDDAEYPADPEAKRGAKGLLGQFMPPNSPYSETADQPALSAVFDLSDSYRRCPSFRKLVKELCRVLEATGHQPTVPPEWMENL